MISKYVDVHLISVYFRHDGNLVADLARLDRALEGLRGQRVIVGGDVNAESPLWNSARTTRRGELLEDFLAQRGLVVLNEPGQLPTFSSAAGESFVDVTLATATVSRACRSWRVRDDWTSSDHRAVTLTVARSRGHNGRSTETPVYNLKKADWRLFVGTLRGIWDSKRVSYGDVSPNEVPVLTRHLTESLSRAMATSMPRAVRRMRKANPSWWTPELRDQRADYFQRLKEAQRARTVDERERRLREFAGVRAAYKRALRRAKQSSWRGFVTREGARTPWGLGSRIHRGVLKTETLLSTVRGTQGVTRTYGETMQTLMNSLVPDDDPAADDKEQRNLRDRMTVLPDTDDNDDPIDLDEVTEVIMRQRRGRAPGPNGIPAEVLRRAWPVVGEDVTLLYAACLDLGVFPDDWKAGTVVAIRKAGDRDPSSVKSYRPICLLNVIGKVFEALVTRRIQQRLQHQGLLSGAQFGFVRGKSTEDAFLALKEAVSITDEKYVLGISLDIQGAFDNVWWPYVLNALKIRGCPRNIYSVLLDYFRNRRVTMRSRTAEIAKTTTKGCPQGSVLGPTLWNVTFDEALAARTEAEETKIAFADDLLVVVSGYSRLEVENRARLALEPLFQWARGAKLSFSPEKSQMLLLKGALDVRRPPCVRVGGQRIAMVREIKYLGVRIGERMNFTGHIQTVVHEARALFAKLGRLSGSGWGYGGRALLTLYKGVIVPRVTYGAALWGGELRKYHVTILGRAQRAALLRVLRAYRTTPTDSLPVLAGVLPMDLHVLRVHNMARLRRGLGIRLGPLRLTGQEIEADRRGAVQRLEEELIRVWQGRWDSSIKGRWTYRFLPGVRLCKRMVAWTDKNVCQIITGHGDFGGYLSRFSLRDDGLCECGEQETAEHVLLHCCRFERQRLRLEMDIDKAYPGAGITPEVLVRPRCVRFFRQFANQVMDLKRQL